MKKKVVLFLFLMSTFVVGSNKGFELGILLGAPTGLSGKLWVGPVGAIDAALAWSFVENDYLHIHADYLWHYTKFMIKSPGEFLPYLGVGGVITVGDDNVYVGVRVPLGISYVFEKVPLDIFLEIAPVLELIPRTDMDLNGGIGLRYMFP